MTNTGSKRTRIGLLGAGYIADLHIDALARITDADIVAVCDLSAARAEQLAAQLGNAKAYTDLDAMLAAENLDVIHNLSPPQVHFPTSRTILNAGVDVYVEKPFCTNSDDCRTLTDLAATNGRRIGVSHNFLRSENYSSLKQDIDAGKLGHLDHVQIVWQKELPHIAAGATDAWMFQSPTNILTEIGPHPFGMLLDLVGEPTELSVSPSNPIVLGSGQTFFRRWQVRGVTDKAAFDVLLSFAPGYTQHFVHARGSLAAATTNFERHTYVRHRHRPGHFDLERFASTAADSVRSLKEATTTFARIVMTKAKLSKFGEPFTHSIGEAIEAFYRSRQTQEVAHGLDGEFATRVIQLVEQVADASGASDVQAKEAPASQGPPSQPDTLVIGGTGFIGSSLVSALVQNGQSVRVVGRSHSRLQRFDSVPVETLAGDLADKEFTNRALDGIQTVYCLAKGQGDTWPDWVRTEVEPMTALAKACLQHSVARLVYTSSIAIFNAGKGSSITNNSPPDEEIISGSDYAKAKATCEQVLLKMHREEGLPVVISRPGIVVGSGGPPEHGGLALWAGGSACVIPGSGNHPLPLVLASEVASALILCGERDGIAGKTLNLIGDVRLTANQYLAELERLKGVRYDKQHKSPFQLYMSEFGKWIVKMAVRHHKRRFPHYREQASLTYARPFDNSETKRELDWAPEANREKFIELGIETPIRDQSE